MRRVPWHVKGIHPDAREVARDAARRSGLSVGEWLNSLIIDATADQRPASDASKQPRRRSPYDGEPAAAHSDLRFASISRQIEELKWRINHLSRDNSAWPVPYLDDAADPRGGPGPIAPGHGDFPYGDAGQARPCRGHDRIDGVDEALAEIAARQQALDGESAETRTYPGDAEPEASPPPTNTSNAEQQLREIGARMKALQNSCRYDGMTTELARTIEEAAPKRAIEGIEEQLRRLTNQIETIRSPASADHHLEQLRCDLADLGRKINETSPQRAVASIEEEIRALTTSVARLREPARIEDITNALRSEFRDIGASLDNSIPPHAIASIEDQIRTLTAEIAQLPRPAPIDRIAEMLRGDLDKIAEALKDAIPTHALVTLEQEVRELGSRIESSRASHHESPVSGDLEHNLAEIRDRLRAMTPAEDFAKLQDAIETLSNRADAVSPERSIGEILHQLEGAIGALNGIGSRIASQDAVAELSRDIHVLAEKLDRDNQQAAESNVMATLDRRLAEMADALSRSRAPETAAIPPDFEVIIRKLADRLESIQMPTSDQAGLKSLEQRIVNLGEKLDLSEARLSQLDGMERSVEDLLSQLKELRTQNEKKLQAIQQQLVDSATQALSAPAEAIRRDVASLKEIQASVDRRTQDTFEAVYGTIEQMVDRLAAIEQDIREPKDHEAAAAELDAVLPAATVIGGPPIVPDIPLPRDRAGAPPASEARATPGQPPKPAVDNSPARPPAPTHARQPIISDLPPDAPLEPGSGARRVRIVNNAIDRIAASEAAIGAVKPAEAASATRANFVAVARRAAQAVASEPGAQPKSNFEAAAPGATGVRRPRGLLVKFAPRIKSLVVGISVAMLVLGALRLALDLFNTARAPSPGSATSQIDGTIPPQSESNQTAPTPPQNAPEEKPEHGAAIEPSVLLGPQNAALSLGGPILGQAPASGVVGEIAFPGMTATAAAPAAPDATSPETTGSSTPQAAASIPSRDMTKDPLPAAIGSKALLAAAAAGEPGASYEIAIRFVEGRNVPQDLAMAAAWFDRAARHGMAPAQFRLGCMYEKGLGLKKDLQEARRLYLAAADKHNAKAMHNLAVLYAEGIDGRPDYAVASHWFGKAAAFGVVDSQYNLAILYARGVGVERNLATSYKWFALAAKGGDKDAAKKRDEVAARLEPPQLENARQAVDAFVPERQPDEATMIKAPAGGWDRTASTTPAGPKATH